jgi:hypothetical protein
MVSARAFLIRTTLPASTVNRMCQAGWDRGDRSSAKKIFSTEEERGPQRATENSKTALRANSFSHFGQISRSVIPIVIARSDSGAAISLIHRSRRRRLPRRYRSSQ